MGADAAVEVRDLVVSRGGVRVLAGISLVIGAAEAVAVGGASGSGKSTLIGAVAGLIPYQQGKIVIAGARQERADRRRAALRLHKIGIVFQGDEFLPELTLVENVCLPSMLRDGSSRVSDYLTDVQHLFSRLGIQRLESRHPAEVSAGQLQRAAVARAILGSPPVILADEPTSALDQGAARDTLSLLLDLAREKGAAICIVTHDRVISARCDRRLLLDEGVLRSAPRCADGPVDIDA